MNARERIRENLDRLQQRIDDARHSAGRADDTIMLVGVAKYVDADVTRALFESGCIHIGESRPQQLWQKAEQLSDCPVHWHLVGHLQRNKVARTVPLVDWVHSGDSLRLLRALDRAASPAEPLKVLLEVNISGDPNKYGWQPETLRSSCHEIATLQNLDIRGLMTIARGDHRGAEAQPDFAALRELRDRLRREAPPAIGLDELSMGMSGDFEYAIMEGATIIRVGTSLFEGLLS